MPRSTTFGSLAVLASILIACGDAAEGDEATTATTTTTAATGGTGATSTTSKGSTKAAAATASANGSGVSTGAGSGTGGGEPLPCPGARPDESNTGAPPGIALTVVDDDVVIDQDGTVVDGQDIHGFLRIEADDVTVRRSIVRGRGTSSTTAILRVESGQNVLIEDVTIDAAEPSVGVDGVWGSGFTARRVHVRGGVDGMKLGSDTVVECSFIHDLAFFASDPNQNGGPTHNDAIQILEGTTIRITGNTLLAETDQNAAIQITQDFGEVGDVHIERNWADGGGCTFNFSHNGGGTLDDLFSTGNRFGRSSFYDCPILKSTQTQLTSTDDVWDDDGTEVPIQTHD